MEKSSTVRLHALISVAPEDWFIFELQLAHIKKIVQQEGDQVLTHECYRQSNTYQCLIVEAYKNEDAILSHLGLIQSAREKFPVRISFHRLELMGSFSAETIGLLRNIDPKCEVRFFNIDMKKEAQPSIL